ncbi:heat-inducible transcriptional repressor HrcA [Phormidium sp. CCY1219]|uniref:heat-inducible transcriptional repressor HrcA n=1 Tax=Phormidium sp. CCY1219 TaxID=2886104 RepID=UPI002D1F2437|nr:heat-inducible transcriptional repressor HrcA [Phormidium sp. CCY1219]
MSVQVNLNERQQYVLWATVRHYIATAEPVGSKTLVEEFNLSVSPATIRNAMGCLEKAGLLYQPHTSAGRVPSDSGYRIYVDKLIQPSSRISRQVEQLLGDRLSWEKWAFDTVLRGASQILATLSGCIALITMPQTSSARLRHLQFMQIEPRKIMVIVVTDSYQTHSAVMELGESPEDPPPDEEIVDRELQILSNFLNTHLGGQTLSELSELDWRELGREFERYAEVLSGWLKDLARRARTPGNTEILISGVSEVLRQPEFSELTQVQTLIQLLEEEQDQLWPLIFEPPVAPGAGQRVNVRIGSENPLEPIRTCTLISSTYGKGSVPLGSVGVLGPTRMVYENAIAMVEAAADYLSEAVRDSVETNPMSKARGLYF